MLLFEQWLFHEDSFSVEGRESVGRLSSSQGMLPSIQLLQSTPSDMDSFIDLLSGHTNVRTVADDHDAHYLHHRKAIVGLIWIPF
jgi:hypothetical protein